MSYDEHDAAWDAFYEQISEELYPDHKTQAIQEFTGERLRSFYIRHPEVMRTAVFAYKEAKELHELGRPGPALVFFVTTIELFLKATLLKPVVYGLVHNDQLAAIVVEHALGQSGFDRYKSLLSNLFSSLAGTDLAEVKRESATEKLLDEALSLQKHRNKVIHQGASCTPEDADRAKAITAAVYSRIVLPMLNALGLEVQDKGLIGIV
jgi:hypothetical protein